MAIPTNIRNATILIAGLILVTGILIAPNIRGSQSTETLLSLSDVSDSTLTGKEGWVLIADPQTRSFHLVPPTQLNPQDYFLAISTDRANLLSPTWLNANALFPAGDGWISVTAPQGATRFYLGAYSTAAAPLPIRWYSRPYNSSDLFACCWSESNTIFLTGAQYYHSVPTFPISARSLRSAYRAFYG